jgi:Flp pilus assembly protein TadG
MNGSFDLGGLHMTLTTIQTVPSLQETPARTINFEKCGKSLRNKRRGAAAVEFAIVLPVFVILVFGMIEYGRMVMVQQVITNASREGARSAVLDGATTSSVQSAVGTYLTNAQISGGSTAVNPSPSSAASGDPITVTVSIPFTAVSWLPSPMYLGGKTLSASTTMRRESVE